MTTFGGFHPHIKNPHIRTLIFHPHIIILSVPAKTSCPNHP
jgi:hypothetical protein